MSSTSVSPNKSSQVYIENHVEVLVALDGPLVHLLRAVPTSVLWSLNYSFQLRLHRAANPNYDSVSGSGPGPG
jgi:hypothetical protein